MKIRSIDEAFKILDDYSRGEVDRVNAIAYITDIPEERVVVRLVKALQDEDYGVRWKASTSLAQLGPMAIPSLIKALMDPDRIVDTRLRRGAVRVLKHMDRTCLPKSVEDLFEALQGSASDVASMEAAYKVSIDFEGQSIQYPCEVPE